jgi:hypothetical protein
VSSTCSQLQLLASLPMQLRTTLMEVLDVNRSLQNISHHHVCLLLLGFQIGLCDLHGCKQYIILASIASTLGFLIEHQNYNKRHNSIANQLVWEKKSTIKKLKNYGTLTLF